MDGSHNTILSLQNISRVYHMGTHSLHALNNISLDLLAGEFLMVLGPSGSGKSTLINMMGGMDSPTSGQIVFEGRDMATASDRQLTRYRRHTVGFIFQMFNLLPTLTALENVQVAAELVHNPCHPRDMLQKVGLAEVADHFPAQLSGGEQQRVAIARALCSNPKILLCDEPTGALDTQTSQKVLNLLIEVCRQFNKTVVMITHNPAFAVIGDRVLHIKDGEIAELITHEKPATVDDIAW